MGSSWGKFMVRRLDQRSRWRITCRALCIGISTQLNWLCAARTETTGTPVKHRYISKASTNWERLARLVWHFFVAVPPGDRAGLGASVSRGRIRSGQTHRRTKGIFSRVNPSRAQSLPDCPSVCARDGRAAQILHTRNQETIRNAGASRQRLSCIQQKRSSL